MRVFNLDLLEGNLTNCDQEETKYVSSTENNLNKSEELKIKQQIWQLVSAIAADYYNLSQI